jgi:serine/threonine-protein kinase
VETEAAHLPAERLDAFLKGTLSASLAGQVELHIDACEECRVLLSTLVRSQRDAAGDPTYQVTVAPVTPGDVVAGKYKVERIIGTGGMGSVVAAWHQQLNQRVALKFMLPAIAADPQAAARFLREGRAAARLSTPHVGRVLDLDSLPNGTPYMVMEFLEGETLAQRLARTGALPAEDALRIVREALIGLAEAHALSIVHRDFKPANLFLARRADGAEVVKVLDFGIAKSVDPDIEHGLGQTSQRMLMGSPPYMAPEQINLGALDARTDVWAVGAVLYELLSGKVPFWGPTLVDVMFAIQNKAPEPLNAPAALVEVVDRCLAKRPEGRYADAAALAGALKDIESVPDPEPAPVPQLKPATRLIAAAAAVALALIVLLTWRLVRSGHSDAMPVQVAEPTRLAPEPPPLKIAPLTAEVVDAPPAQAPAPAPKPAKATRRAPARPASKESAFEERR